MLGILAYVNLKDCTCIKSLADDLVVSFDETVDNPETILINSIDKEIIFLLLLSYCAFTIAGDHRS